MPVLVLVPPLLGRALSSVLERQQSEKYTPLSKHTLPASSDLTHAQTLFFFFLESLEPSCATSTTTTPSSPFLLSQAAASWTTRALFSTRPSSPPPVSV